MADPPTLQPSAGVPELAEVAPDDWSARPPSRVYREVLEPLSHVAGHIRIGVDD